MDNKEFIESKPLELCLTTKEAKALRKVLAIANESYVFEHTDTKAVKVGNLQYYNFYIICPTITFANAYFHLGILYAKHVLPIYQSRYKKNK